MTEEAREDGGAEPYDLYLCAKAMQQALQRLGLYTDTIDGRWGTKSRCAYNRFNRMRAGG